MTDAEEKKDVRGTLRIDRTLYDQLLDEQERLRKAEGKRPSHTDLLQRLLNAYRGLEPQKPAPQPPSHPSTTPHGQFERELVAGLLLLFRDRREIAQGVKEIVAGLLTNWVNKAKAAAHDDVNGGKKSA